MYQTWPAGVAAINSLPVRVEATVLPDIVSDSEAIEFGPGLPDRVVIRFSPRDGTSPFRLLDATASRQAFATEVDPGAGTVTVVYRPDLTDPTNPPAGLTIRTDHPSASTVVLPISVRQEPAR